MNWLKNFKPHMVVYVEYHAGPYEDVYVCMAVCADRVFRVRQSVAISKAKDNKRLLKLLKG